MASRIVGDRLHDRRDEGDIEADAGLLATSEADQRCGQRDVLWGALTCREPWDKEVLPESAGDFVDEYAISYMDEVGDYLRWGRTWPMRSFFVCM